MPRATLTAAAVLLLSAPALAQESGSVQPGTRVRVFHHCAEEYDPGNRAERVECDQETGTVASVNSDSLVIDVNEKGSLRAIGVDQIYRLQVSGGKAGAGAQGALYGALGGALGGALFGIAICNSVDESTNSPGACALGGAAALAVPGALLGLILGHSIGKESWVEVPVESLRVSLRPAAGGVGVGLTIQF